MLASPEITWALILGFALSAMVQAVVRRSTIAGLLGDRRPRTLALARSLFCAGHPHEGHEGHAH